MLVLFHVFPDSDLMTRRPRLLIVEDEAAIRSGLVDVFVYHGYEVETAEHGEVGLKMALGGSFDLVLLDVMLPGMDGFEICNRIRQQDRQQPVIMLTAKSSDEDIVQGLTLGADDYVANCMSSEFLKRSLRQLGSPHGRIDHLVFLLYSGAWCNPCRQMKPHVGVHR